MRTLRTTGQLVRAFEVARQEARTWLAAMPGRARRPSIYLPPDGSSIPAPSSRGPHAFFPGSFDPPTRAHLQIARTAIRKERWRSLVIAFDIDNVDKTGHALSLADRIALCVVAFRKEARVGFAVFSHGRFLEKIEAIRRKSGFSGDRISFVVGEDTMQRLLDPRFYKDPHGEIEKLVDAATFFVFPRTSPRQNDLGQTGLRPAVVALPLPPEMRSISSTDARGALRAGEAPIDAVPAEVVYCSREMGLYSRSRPPPADVVTSFLTRGGRVLILKRSDRVGSYRGSWAALSGYVEWPLSKIPDILGGHIAPSRIRDQMLKDARREIREETRLPDASLVLKRRGKPLLLRAPERKRDWQIYTFLFEVKGKRRVRLDWENEEGCWIYPEEMDRYPTVPGLSRAFARLRQSTAGKPAGTFVDRAARIAGDPRRGAMEIFGDATRLLRELSEYGAVGAEAAERELEGVREALVSGHPMAPLENLVDALRKELAGAGTDLHQRLLRLVDRMERLAARGHEQMVKKAIARLGGSRSFATYSYSSAVADVLSRLGRRKGVHVAILDDPGGHGRRLRRKLALSGVDTSPLVRELPAATDAVVLGCDAIYGKGSFLNARGSRQVTEQARKRGVAVWVLGHTLKVRARRPARLRDPSLEVIPARGVTILT
ncbi:MAG: NUDIX domain-containing protein [Planctomycetota bacterium]|nr:NUDIX domain-containing protein [Planctomycetota bacterium]